ncbi:MAG: hypothetical protein CVU42_04265 [Chloroflexi bacterium HGW-Chloroflexi-4]|jgi:hypothetical protein|nr:MAG: hypothetical protein CVU42_04265 [Chloroflexi bacterium HGW-Chloroflexi-4]
MSPIVSGVFVIFGIVFLIVWITSKKKAEASQKWPTVPGLILSTRIDIHNSTDNDGGTSTSYKPVVSYSYSIMGQEYTANRIAFGANTFSRKKCDSIIARYPVNQQVIVHYNPEELEDAVLETQAQGGLLSLVLGCILIGVGLFFLVISFIL